MAAIRTSFGQKPTLERDSEDVVEMVSVSSGSVAVVFCVLGSLGSVRFEE